MVELGIEPGTYGSVARNSDHKTTEAVSYTVIKYFPFQKYIV
jgi:hypothetical protein